MAETKAVEVDTNVSLTEMFQAEKSQRGRDFPVTCTTLSFS